jgi:hypothetical protein
LEGRLEVERRSDILGQLEGVCTVEYASSTGIFLK